jgi:Protein of unknown function (DUF559)
MMKEICSIAEELIQGIITEQSLELRRFLLQCGSPVEQILVVALCNNLRAPINTHYNRMQGILIDFPDWDGLFTVIVELQKTIKPTFSGSTYRADLYIYLTRFWMNGEQPKWGELVVEVDGHDFHDRTKEQASRDRQRDREMLRDGLKVIRFTGSDIYNEPFKHAEEILSHIGDEAGNVFRSYARTDRLAELIMGPDRST